MKRTPHLLCAAVLPLLLAAPSSLLGAGLREESFVRIRVVEKAGETVLECPLAFLQALPPTGATLPLGTRNGRALRLAVDPLVRTLRALPADSREKLVLSRSTDGGPVEFYAKVTRRRVFRSGETPTWLDTVFERRDLSPVQRTQLALPLAAGALLGPRLFALCGVPADPGVLPLAEGALKAAQATGAGPLLDARTSWGRLLLTCR